MFLHVVDLGSSPYAEALELQRAVARARIAGTIADDVLLIVEHPPVVTLGRGAKPGHLLATDSLLQSRGVELFEVERGGDVTYHGPGQLVGYPVMDLKRHRQDLHWYLRQIEESLVRAMRRFDLACFANPGLTGVWTSGPDASSAGLGTPPPSGATPTPLRSAEPGSGPNGPFGVHGGGPVATIPRKIASIGVHAREWVTWHGFALNVTTDLSNFDLIVPCGISNVTMTSVQRELGENFPGTHAVSDAVIEEFANVFGLSVERRAPSWLDAQLAVPTDSIQTNRAG